jgi:hypothetical protein
MKRSRCHPSAKYSSPRRTPTLQSTKSAWKPRSSSSSGNYLYDNHSGWENNDGAFGTFEFSVPDRTIALQHNDRYTDVYTTTHEF